jgi:microcin C transport system substrate-binding protein
MSYLERLSGMGQVLKMRCFFLYLALLFSATPAVADPAMAPSAVASPAIAMHGTPKYPPHFTHFDYVNPNAPKGGTLRQAVVGTFDSLNPFILKGRPAMGGNLVFESLMARGQDEPFTLYGLLAESVETPQDRSWVRFTLRPEARWADGTAVTADDILFSWDTLKTKGRPNHRAYYSRVERAEKLDDRTVRFTFTPTESGAPDRELPLIMGLMPILSKQDWQGRTFSDTSLTPPMGSGPYRVAAIDPGRSISYDRRADYWGRNLPVNRGLYNFDLIRFDYYRDDSVALEAFKAGQVDIRREYDPARWARSYDFPAVTDGLVRLESLPHGRTEPALSLIYNTRRPLFSDPVLRQALAYAFDFEWINKTLFHGLYRRNQSYFPNSDLSANFTLPQTDGTGLAGLRGNLVTATELLKKAGYSIQDGWLYPPQSNRPVAFEILLADPADEKVALEFSRSLARLGVAAKIRTVDSAQYQMRLSGFDFDMTIGRWFNSLSPGNEQLTYWGSDAADIKGSRNYPGIRSRAIDKLAGSIPEATTRDDLKARTRALDLALLQGWYTIPLYHLGVDYVASWTGFHHPATLPLYGTLLESWWQDP